MAPRSPHVEATIVATVCTIREWHPTTSCEHSEEEEVRRLKRLKSDLFKPHERDVPASQKEIMKRNHSTSPFLRIPPEIRLRIYRLVLGGQKVWIGHSGSEVKRKLPEQQGQSGQYFHRWGHFYHSTADPFHSVNPFNNVLNIGLLRVCRHVYTETALLPYELNTFTFRDDSTRRLFEQSARPGKKRVQKKAVGEYDIASWLEFRGRQIAKQEASKVKP